MADQQPGEVIIPIDRSENAQPLQMPAPSPSFDSTPVSSPADTPLPSFTPAAEPAQQIPAPVEPVAAQISEPPQQVPDPYTPHQSFNAPPSNSSISWQSVEFIAHDKDSSWYGAMVLGSILISIVVYILNRDIITACIILIALVGLTYVSSRKPREQQFEVSMEGVQVGRNYYAFHDFRSFSVDEDPTSVSIVLVPLKRFMPAINIFVPADYEEKVVNFISNILPFEQRKTDVVDNIMRRIKF